MPRFVKKEIPLIAVCDHCGKYKPNVPVMPYYFSGIKIREGRKDRYLYLHQDECRDAEYKRYREIIEKRGK